MTTIVVLPIALPMAAEIFKEMAMTIAFLISLVDCSIIFVPMLSSKFIKITKAKENSDDKLRNKLFIKG